MSENYSDYHPDVLGDEFEKMTLDFPDDYEGKVISTLIRRMAKSKSEKAVLYIHGFNDYFFQKELAVKFNQNGYNFYALDLRKYGRSYLSHQKFNNVRSLEEYDDEINLALQIIKSENNSQTILMGHSTGGLITTNYVVNHSNSNLYHGLICNSPFYKYNLNFVLRKTGIPLISFLGKYAPDISISGGFSEYYGYSLHQEKYGEWNYSLAWKPYIIPKINLSFIRAIHKAQQNIKQNSTLKVPTLVMHSDKSIDENQWSEKFKKGDAVLNSKHIKEFANRLNGDITVSEIECGMHDLVLSTKPIREKVYHQVFKWINNSFDKNHNYT